jgi:hypothetical protein
VRRESKATERWVQNVSMMIPLASYSNECYEGKLIKLLQVHMTANRRETNFVAIVQNREELFDYVNKSGKKTMTNLWQK